MEVLFILMFNDLGFWINFLIPVGIGLFLYFTHKGYILKELGLQTLVTLIVVVFAFLLSYRFTTDMYEVNYWNGSVSEFTYEEPWEEEYDCSYQQCDSKGQNCVTIPSTCYTDHSSQYYIITSNNEHIDISKSNYNTAKLEFGAVETELHRSGQTLSSRAKGEGDIWHVYPNIVIPTSVGHIEPNYIKLQRDNVIHNTFSEEELSNPLLVPFPTLKHSKYGKIKLDRVIQSNAKVPYSFIKTLNEELSQMAAILGKSKQVNPMVYLVDTDNMSFKYLLEAYNNNGHKNDSILILSIRDNKIQWSDLVGWTEDSDFITDCNSKYTGLSIDNPQKIAQVYKSSIVQNWHRTEMKSKEYMASNVSLDWWVHLLVFIVNLIVSLFIFNYTLEMNMGLKIERMLSKWKFNR